MKFHILKFVIFILIVISFILIPVSVCISRQNKPSLDSNKIDIIYKKYYSNPKIDYKKTDYSDKFMQELGKSNIKTLINNLTNNAYPANQVPEALQCLGLKLLQGNRGDDAIKIYQCAAEKHFDMFSMYRLAQAYFYGTESFKKRFPELVIKNDIKIDYKKSYYWLVSIFYVEMAEQTGLVSPENQFGWNTIAILDDLQNSKKLSDQEMISIENQVREFIGKRYPDILKSDQRVYYHKIPKL